MDTDEPILAPDGHVPVMLNEVLELLAPRPGETVVDCTAGLGGHSEALARAVGPTGLVVGFDVDAGNLSRAAARVEEAGGRCLPIHANFRTLAEQLQTRSIRADAVLADLGFSSNQVSDPTRGLTFSADGYLDMRLDASLDETAADLLARLDERELADLIYHFGGDPFARRIARKLIQKREQEPIQRTVQLASLVEEAYGPRARKSRRRPATRTFMALRIAVNDELGSLQGLMDRIEAAARSSPAASNDPGAWLRDGARIAVISFHSLEDRIVKQSFASLAKGGHAERLTRKPLTPTPTEMETNPRARSAKLRAIRITRPTAPA